MKLLQPLAIGTRSAPSRVMLGPIVTNLGDDDRALTERHVAFYERRARGGAGVVVVEGASVHPGDWPYERAPLAERCGAGWERIVGACRPHGTLVVAGLDHAGGQGSSAYSQRELWAPSRVPEVNSREVPKWMEPDDIAEVVHGFAAGAKLAVEAGCDGVEIGAGQHSLVRQFLSGLTNQRSDEWGGDRLLFAREVLRQVRDAVGVSRVVGLRLSCDELAPWAGITPDAAIGIASALADHVDYVVVVRGSIFSVEQTRPDFHEPTGFNIDVCRSIRAALPARVTVFLQGSVVDHAQAVWALLDGVADGVEMTRGLLADPDLVAKLRADRGERVRPCIRCNQTCQVRDARNPIITCVGEPSTGRETEDPNWEEPATDPRHVVVVGAGPAGLETARVAAERGHHVRLVERAAAVGGMAAVAGPAKPLVDWMRREVHRLGVTVEAGVGWAGPGAPGQDEVVVQCTGGRPGERPYECPPDAVAVLDIGELRAGRASLPEDGTVVVFDPIGGPIAVALAEELGGRAVLVTQDQIAGNELSRTGDLAPANVRLAQRAVTVERRSLLRRVTADGVELEDRFTGESRHVVATAMVDCGFRLPTDRLPGAHLMAGDCVAPRTVMDAVLEGRRAALAIDEVVR